MSFDATQPFTDAEYRSFIKPLIDSTVSALRLARESNKSPIQAITDYLQTAYAANISIGECVDYFCVSSPSIVESAGYSEPEQQQVIDCFDKINSVLSSKYFK
jgi:hypothetical protein